MKILEITNLNKTKYIIICEDKVVFSLYKSELRNLSLETGSDISEEKYNYIKNEILLKRCKERALHLIEVSDKTEYQIRTKLKEGYYPNDVIDRTVQFLKKYSYIDDKRYIENYINTYKSRKSFRTISNDLSKKGININEIIKENDFLCEFDNEDNEREQILSLLAKKKYSEICNDPKEKNKVIAYILRRGYSYELVCLCIRSLDCK